MVSLRHQDSAAIINIYTGTPVRLFISDGAEKTDYNNPLCFSTNLS